MAEFTTPQEVISYPYPDMLADYRWEGFVEQIDRIHRMGLSSVFLGIQIFEPAWYLRGLENLLVDMMTDEEMALACISIMTEFQCEITKRVALSGVDIIIFGDDVGSQKEMLISPDLWRKWLKPAMKKAIQTAKIINPDVLAYYHSDGVINEIIPDLIDIGLDILNPVQPECMDPAEIKNLYGDKLSFWGTVGTQTTMPFGSIDEVKSVVKDMIQKVGIGGGLCISPTHLIEPEVPWENIVAFVEAVKKYGKY